MLALALYRYAVTGGRVAAAMGMRTIAVEDAAGDGHIHPDALARALAPEGASGAALWGAAGDDPARDPVIALTDERGFAAFTVYTPQRLHVGDALSLPDLCRDFAPFCPPPPDVVCFAAEALIDTARGRVPAGALHVGDRVRTRDEGLQPIRWIGRQPVDAGRLALQPNLQPVRIRAGALGNGAPDADLILSPQHRVLIRSPIAQRMFGAPEVLVAAKQLCQLDGIDVAQDLSEVVYIHFLFDDHQIVFSNGAETESLLVGPEALKSVGIAARAEILTLFPELADHAAVPARTVTSGRMARKLAVRHLQNQRPLVN